MPVLEANGSNLHYDVHGHGDPLLFIHGLGASSLEWEPQIREFARSHQVITLDLRGHGRSERPTGPYTMALFAADSAAVLNAIGVGPAHVVGVSMGGSVAFQLALDAPELVRTLTVVNSSPEWLVRSPMHRIALWQRLLIVRLLGMRRMGELIARKMLRPDQRAEFVARFAENDRDAYFAALRAMVGWTVTARLVSLVCPTLVVASEHDITPIGAKKAYAALIPNAEVAIVPDAHHALPLEKPAEFNAVLREFLDRQSRQARASAEG